MNALFHVAAGVAVVATLLVITASEAVHALLYFIVSLFAVGVVFLLLGAPLAAALEVIVYAGAIMVLFAFAVMLLHLGPEARQQERRWLEPEAWLGPSALVVVLLLELGYILYREIDLVPSGRAVGPGDVAAALYGPYVLGVELASMLLLAGVVGALHLGRRGAGGRSGEVGREAP